MFRLSLAVAQVKSMVQGRFYNGALCSTARLKSGYRSFGQADGYVIPDLKFDR